MKNFEAKFWRGNPQSKSGGYETTRRIEAKTEKAALKKAKAYENGCAYGTMEFLEMKEVKNELAKN